MRSGSIRKPAVVAPARNEETARCIRVRLWHWSVAGESAGFDDSASRLHCRFLPPSRHHTTRPGFPWHLHEHKHTLGSRATPTNIFSVRIDGNAAAHRPMIQPDHCVAPACVVSLSSITASVATYANT